MKNKKLLKALAAFTMSIAAAGSMSLFGCAHKHTYSDEWDRSAEGHWHNATCKHTDEKTEIEPHIYTDSQTQLATFAATIGKSSRLNPRRTRIPGLNGR